MTARISNKSSSSGPSLQSRGQESIENVHYAEQVQGELYYLLNQLESCSKCRYLSKATGSSLTTRMRDLLKEGLGKCHGLNLTLSSARLDLLSQRHCKPMDFKPRLTKKCYSFPLMFCPTPSVMAFSMCSNPFSTDVKCERFSLLLAPTGTQNTSITLLEHALRKSGWQKRAPFHCTGEQDSRQRVSSMKQCTGIPQETDLGYAKICLSCRDMALRSDQYKFF